jgi:PII-like signaling protein
MRIFIGESDRCMEGEHKGAPLYEALVSYFRERGFAGATVLRGIAGFGASARVHTDRILRLSLDLPIIVEVVESEEAIREVLPVLDGMIGGGLITLERVRVILYRPADAADDERARHRLEGLEPE